MSNERSKHPHEMFRGVSRDVSPVRYEREARNVAFKLEPATDATHLSDMPAEMLPVSLTIGRETVVGWMTPDQFSRQTTKKRAGAVVRIYHDRSWASRTDIPSRFLATTVELDGRTPEEIDETFEIFIGKNTFAKFSQVALWNVEPNVIPRVEQRADSPFSVERVKAALEQPVALEETPAFEILMRQMERIERYVDAHEPPLSALDRAYAIASQFEVVEIDFCIAEGTSGEIPPHERSESVADLTQALPVFSKEINGVVERLRNDPVRKDRLQIDTYFKRDWCLLQQGDLKQVDYRIYLAPELAQVPGLFQELARKIPPEVDYEMKTFTDHHNNPLKLGRRDKIIVYVPEKDLPEILRQIDELILRHPEAFKGQLPPGGGNYVPAEGVSIAKEQARELGTGTQFMAGQFKGALDREAEQLLGSAMDQFSGTIQEFFATVQGELMWKTLTTTGQWGERDIKGYWFLATPPQGVENEEGSQELTDCLSAANFEEWFLCLREHRALEPERIKQGFLRRLDQTKQVTRRETWRQEIAALSEVAFTNSYLSGRQSFTEQSRLAGLALSVYLLKARTIPAAGALHALIT